MTHELKIALAQLNPTVGDIAGNVAHAAQARARPRPRSGADMVLITELFISGYPPEDLVLKPAFQAGVPQRAGGAGRRHRRWRAGDAGRRAVDRGRQAADNGCSC